MANFLAEVLQAKGSATIEGVHEMLASVTGKISQLKISIIQSMNSTFVLYETDLDRVIQWYSEIVEIEKELISLEGELGQDNQVLQSAHEDLLDITRELEECQKSIENLKSLVNVVKNLERADPTDYYHASHLIRKSEEELSNISRSLPTAEDHIWIKQLRARFSDLVVDVYDNCRRDWGNLFRFDKNSLQIFPHSTNIANLIESLKNVKSFNRVWEKFLNMLWQELIKPSCSNEYIVEVSGNEVSKHFKGGREDMDYPGSDEKCSMFGDISYLNVEDESKEGIFIKAIKLEKPYKDAQELFKNITEVIGTVYSFFQNNETEWNSLTKTIAPKINDELNKKYLRNLILQRCGGDIVKAKADMQLMKTFVDDLQTKHRFYFPEGSIFDQIDQNFENLFKAQVKEALIVKIRDLIKADVHNTEEINYEAMPNSSLSADEIVLLRKNPALFPRCVVSKPVGEMVRLLKDHMKKYPGHVSICSSVFSLYLALVKIPKHEADAGEAVPLTSVLIHNNSLFLAHHAGFTFEICDDMVPDLRAKASQAIAFMMRCVRSKLNEMMSTSMWSIEERVEQNKDITNDFLVITAELKRLDTVIKDVLPPLRWNEILATLVDHTVNELCSKVLAWDDIRANTASEIANAFTQFAVATSSLFKGDASTPREVEALTTRAVKKWQRFRLLIFVLTASMKEIETKWVGGCGPLAIEYTPEEVRRLVRALFQNTDRRAAFLATIK